jgi:hypothetical protein
VYPGAAGGILLSDERRAGAACLVGTAAAVGAAARTALAETRPVAAAEVSPSRSSPVTGWSAVTLHVPGQTEFAETEVALSAPPRTRPPSRSTRRRCTRSSDGLECLREPTGPVDFVAVVTRPAHAAVGRAGVPRSFAEQTKNGKNGHGLISAEATAQVERLTTRR